MNLGLITSYIVAGVLFLSIVSMNMSISGSSNEITMSQITRDKTATVKEIISSDIQKIGYNRTGKTNPILTIAEGKKIQFRSNIDNSNDDSVELVTWELTNSGVPTTQNPNDLILKRTIQNATSGTIISETPITLGVTKFNIAYYDIYGEPLSDSLSTPVTGTTLNDIKQLYISLKIESGEKVSYSPNDPGNYVRSVWEKRFSPPNLEF